MGGIRKKKRFVRSLAGFLLTSILGFSCPEVESLAEGVFGMGSSGCGVKHQLGNADCRTDSNGKSKLQRKRMYRKVVQLQSSTDNASFTWKKEAANVIVIKWQEAYRLQVNGNYYYFGFKVQCVPAGSL
ncbi:MAG: hypothetical protein ACLVG5_05380 [Clostridium sp.]